MSDNNRFKFRIWDVQGQNFMYFDLSDKESLSDFGYFATEECPDYNEQIRCPDANCWALIIEQCTGLTDKNGKLVYEGDILKSGIHHYQVAWHEGKFVLNRGCKNYPISGCELMEIIGNIHKNSELPQCEKNL